VNRQNTLLRYIASRLALAPLMIWLISSLVFLLLRVAPGDPVDAILGNRANEASRELLRAKLGLNQPLINQYLKFLNNLLHGNFGESLNTQEPVSQLISRALPASLELGFCALIIALTIGFAIGFIGIARPESNTDFFGRIYGISTYALPPFWAAMLIQIIFAVNLGWLPIGGRFPPNLIEPQGSGLIIIDSLINRDWISFQAAIRHILLPSFTLGILLSGIFSRSLRINLEKILKSNYIEAATSRGISKYRIILRHALPNTLIPLLTITGLTIASLVGGTLLIEVTFSWPGLALSLQEAINQRDYTVVQGIVVTVASMVVIISLTIDLLIAFIDPRIRY
tara:strand:- start:3060 stop:4079 length:1020 start_codon:yes stop_codon:yes gene_type:complete